jgi:hypothetical protein
MGQAVDIARLGDKAYAQTVVWGASAAGSNDEHHLIVKLSVTAKSPLIFTAVNVNRGDRTSILTKRDNKAYSFEGDDCAPIPEELGVQPGESLSSVHGSDPDALVSDVLETQYTIPLTDLELSSTSGCELNVLVYAEVIVSMTDGDTVTKAKRSLWATSPGQDILSVADTCTTGGEYFGMGKYTLCGLPICNQNDP